MTGKNTRILARGSANVELCLGVNFVDFMVWTGVVGTEDGRIVLWDFETHSVAKEIHAHRYDWTFNSQLFVSNP